MLVLVIIIIIVLPVIVVVMVVVVVEYSTVLVYRFVGCREKGSISPG